MFHQFPLTNKRRHLFDRKKLHLLSTRIKRRDSVIARGTLRSELTFKWETGGWSLVFNVTSYISELAFNCYLRYWGTDLRVLSGWHCYQQRDWEPVASKTIRMFRQFPLKIKGDIWLTEKFAFTINTHQWARFRNCTRDSQIGINF